jgi:predicted anti-sigma-YlaC factor YlaD
MANDRAIQTGPGHDLAGQIDRSAHRATSARPKHVTRDGVVIAFLALMTATKLIFAAYIPLAGDEALYWTYSNHLAPGFIDHPFMNPLLIRIGATLFGDTELGVRFMAVMLSIAATWAVWRAAAQLFPYRGMGATAAILFNMTLAVSVGSLAATSDMVVVCTSALLLYFLAKLEVTGRGAWWLAIGAAFGFGMCSKYTTAFFSISILVWLILVPKHRHWLVNPWTWAGGCLALLIFLPVLLWNAHHHWASFGYQAHRMASEQISLRYVGELIGSQLILATPPVLVLGALMLFRRSRPETAEGSGHILLQALVMPVALFFLLHSLQERVQGNWPEPVYPALAVSAAAAIGLLRDKSGPASAIARWCSVGAVPVGVALALIVLLQGAFGFIPIGNSDPTSRILGYGMKPVAARVEALSQKIGARAILTLDYTTLAWLTFYQQTPRPVEQINERIRWINAPSPDAGLLSGPILFVCRASCPHMDDLRRQFETVDFLAVIDRTRAGVPVATFSAYRLQGPRRTIFDPVYPPMNSGGRDE